jgi:hypothetical protein
MPHDLEVLGLAVALAALLVILIYLRTQPPAQAPP